MRFKLESRDLPLESGLQSEVTDLLMHSFPGLPATEVSSRFASYQYIITARRNNGALVGVLFVSRHESAERVYWGFRMNGVHSTVRNLGLLTKMSHLAISRHIIPDLVRNVFRFSNRKAFLGFARVCNPIAARTVAAGQVVEPQFQKGLPPSQWTRIAYREMKTLVPIKELDVETGLCLGSAEEHGILPNTVVTDKDSAFMQNWKRTVPSGSELVLVFRLDFSTLLVVSLNSMRKSIKKSAGQMLGFCRSLVVLLFSLWAAALISLVAPIKLNLARRISKFWAQSCLRLFGIRYVIIGNVPYGASHRVFAAQHTSLVDTFLYPAILPIDTAYFAKAELKKLPLLSLAYRRLGHRFLERSRGHKELRDFKKKPHLLSAEHSYFIHPQGTRFDEDVVDQLKVGAAVVAKQTKLAIQPVLSRGGAVLWKRGRLWPEPGVIEVMFPEEIAAGEVESLSPKELTRTLKNRMEAALGRRD